MSGSITIGDVEISIRVSDTGAATLTFESARIDLPFTFEIKAQTSDATALSSLARLAATASSEISRIAKDAIEDEMSRIHRELLFGEEDFF